MQDIKVTIINGTLISYRDNENVLHEIDETKRCSNENCNRENREIKSFVISKRIGFKWLCKPCAEQCNKTKIDEETKKEEAQGFFVRFVRKNAKAMLDWQC